MTSVVVLGGGMGGLAAADELSQRGFQVTVYERWDRWGGKARSFGRYGTAADGRRDLPGEHGFRFFPGFYKHVPASMKQTPGENGSCFDALVQASRVVIAQTDGPRLTIPSRFPRTKASWKLAIETFRNRRNFGIPSDQIETFAMKLLDLMAMSPARRDKRYMDIAWWDYIEADKMSCQYQKLLARGLTRSLVAMQAEVACTRTVGNILIQMIQYMIIPGRASDRVLDGPTSQVWIEYWRDKLQKQGVTMVPKAHVNGIEFKDDRISAADITVDGENRRVTGDYFVSAVPVEVFARWVTEDIAKAAHSLANLKKLDVEWMNGLVFYLKRDVAITHGHCILADSPWALTAISQAQFWNRSLDDYGRGTAKGVLSIDISNWTTCGDQVVKKKAMDCGAEQIATEAWAQVTAHFKELSDDDLIAPLESKEPRSWFLDPDIDTGPNEEPKQLTAAPAPAPRGMMPLGDMLGGNQPGYSGAKQDHNAEPLLINTQGSWSWRPNASTEIQNLFIASDYVRTYTDLATMEGANEAGRRATNHILDAEGSNRPRAEVFPLKETWLFAPFRGLDLLLFKLGLPAINWHWLWWLQLRLVKALVHLASSIWHLFKVDRNLPADRGDLEPRSAKRRR